VRFTEESTREIKSLASSASSTYLTTTNTVRAAGTDTITRSSEELKFTSRMGRVSRTRLSATLCSDLIVSKSLLLLTLRLSLDLRQQLQEKETEKKKQLKRNRESLGSSDSTRSSNDETFQPAKLDGAASADFDQYSFEDNKSELAILGRNGKIYDISTGGGSTRISQEQ
jgi:hypothetical protein